MLANSTSKAVLHGLREGAVEAGHRIRFQHPDHQRAGLLKELVVFPGVGGEGFQAMAEVDVALAQPLTCFSTSETALPEAWETCR